VRRAAYSLLTGSIRLLNSVKFNFPSLFRSCLLNRRYTSSWVNWSKPKLSRRETIMSWTEMLPVPLVSNILKASSRLKSGFRAASIFAPSSSLSKNMFSFRTLANSDCSILSKFPYPAAFLGRTSAYICIGFFSAEWLALSGLERSLPPIATSYCWC